MRPVTRKGATSPLVKVWSETRADLRQSSVSAVKRDTANTLVIRIPKATNANWLMLLGTA